MRYLIAVLILMAACVVAGANNYHYRGGYYYYGDNYHQAYTRSVYSYTPGSYYCGRYYPESYSYLYTPYTAPYVAPITPATPNWKTAMIGLAETKLKYDQEALAFEQYRRGLGLENIVGPAAAYGLPYGVTEYSRAFAYGQFVPGASTQYGISSYNQQAPLPANVADFLLGQKQGYDAAIKSGDNALVLALAQSRNQQAAMALEAFKAALNVQVQETKTLKFGQLESSKLTVPADKKTAEILDAQFVALANDRCIKCHAGKVTSGGFDMTTWGTLSAKDRQKIVTEQILTGKMPKDAPAFTDQQKGLFIIAAKD